MTTNGYVAQVKSLLSFRGSAGSLESTSLASGNNNSAISMTPDNLTALQAYNIEQALIKNRKVEAVKLYREASGADLTTAKQAVDRIEYALREEKLWHFKGRPELDEKPDGIKRVGITPKAIVSFLLIDALIVAGVVYYFFFQGSSSTTQSASQTASQQNAPAGGYQTIGSQTTGPQTSDPKTPDPKTFGPQTSASQSAANEPTENDSESDSREIKSQPKPLAKPLTKPIHLPPKVDAMSYTALLSANDTLDDLYAQKIASPEYQSRKNSSSMSRKYDDSLLERKIKSARSVLASQRRNPHQSTPIAIGRQREAPILDGVISPQEWQGATVRVLDENLGTTLYLMVVRDWLYIACDAPEELSGDGYDQLRFYIHVDRHGNLQNERIHVGRGGGVTSIRQTQYRWQGVPPSDTERWKRYEISDWGIYQYAVGTSSMATGHRQYEAVIHLGEAGLHEGVPFAAYAEVETDPRRDQDGKFAGRQYLGFWGSDARPHWLVY